MPIQKIGQNSDLCLFYLRFNTHQNFINQLAHTFGWSTIMRNKWSLCESDNVGFDSSKMLRIILATNKFLLLVGKISFNKSSLDMYVKRISYIRKSGDDLWAKLLSSENFRHCLPNTPCQAYMCKWSLNATKHNVSTLEWSVDRLVQIFIISMCGQEARLFFSMNYNGLKWCSLCMNSGLDWNDFHMFFLNMSILLVESPLLLALFPKRLLNWLNGCSIVIRQLIPGGPKLSWCCRE